MKRLFLFLVVGFLLCVSLTASADIIENVTLNEGYNINDYGKFNFPVLGQKNVYDNYNANVSGGSIIQTGNYEAFCVENAWTTGYNNTYTVLSIDSSLGNFNGLNTADLFQASWIAEKYYTVNKEAAQIAIWEIMFDSNYNILPNTGGFYYISGVDSATIDNAKAYLSEVQLVNFATDYRSNWVLAVNPTVQQGGTVSLASSQNYIFRASNPVPEPATMLLLGAGLVVLAGFGRKKLLK